MRLECWLSSRNMSETEFARRLGVEPSTITRLIPGEGKKHVRRPGWALMLSIKEETKGEVTADDWLDAYADAPPTCDGVPTAESRP